MRLGYPAVQSLPPKAACLRILLFTSQFPLPTEPSRCIFAGQLATALSAEVDLEVLAPQPWLPWLPKRLMRPDWEPLKNLPSSAVMGGVRVWLPRYVSVPGFTRASAAQWMVRGAEAVARRLHRQRPFDAIHARWLYPEGVAAIELGKRLGLPVVLTAMGCDANEYPSLPVIGPQIRAALPQAAALTGVSKPIVDILGSLGGGRVRVFHTPNGIDTTLFGGGQARRVAARQRFGMADAVVHLGYVGRFSTEKAVGVLLAAVADLAPTLGRPLHLWLAGNGPDRAALEAQAAACGIQDSVTFLGSIPHSEVAERLAAFDLLCLPSLREGMPNVVVESLASGTPVVASRVGAVPELLDENCGRMAEPGNAASLAAALREAIAIDWDRAAVARNVAGSWTDAARGYVRAYQAALGKD